MPCSVRRTRPSRCSSARPPREDTRRASTRTSPWCWACRASTTRPRSPLGATCPPTRRPRTSTTCAASSTLEAKPLTTGTVDQAGRQVGRERRQGRPSNDRRRTKVAGDQVAVPRPPLRRRLSPRSVPAPAGSPAGSAAAVASEPDRQRAGRALLQSAHALVEGGRDAGEQQRHQRDRHRREIVEQLAVEQRRLAREAVEPVGNRIERRARSRGR